MSQKNPKNTRKSISKICSTDNTKKNPIGQDLRFRVCFSSNHSILCIIYYKSNSENPNLAPSFHPTIPIPTNYRFLKLFPGSKSVVFLIRQLYWFYTQIIYQCLLNIYLSWLSLQPFHLPLSKLSMSSHYSHPWWNSILLLWWEISDKRFLRFEVAVEELDTD